MQQQRWEHKYSRQLGALGGEAQSLASFIVRVHLDPSGGPIKHTAAELLKNLALLGVKAIQLQPAFGRTTWADPSAADFAASLAKITQELNPYVRIDVVPKDVTTVDVNGDVPQVQLPDAVVEVGLNVDAEGPSACNVACRTASPGPLPYFAVTTRSAFAGVFADLGQEQHCARIPMLTEHAYIVENAFAPAINTQKDADEASTSTFSVTLRLRRPHNAICRPAGGNKWVALAGVATSSHSVLESAPDVDGDECARAVELVPLHYRKRRLVIARVDEANDHEDMSKPLLTVTLGLSDGGDGVEAEAIANSLTADQVEVLPLPQVDLFEPYPLGHAQEREWRSSVASYTIACLAVLGGSGGDQMQQRLLSHLASTQEDRDCLSDAARRLVALRHVELHPLATMIAAVVAHEITKLATPRTTRPLIGWAVFNAAAICAVPTDTTDTSVDLSADASSNDVLRGFFGAAGADRLARARLFLVGCGAIGCEYLKNFAALGFPLREAGGEVVVTDDDGIEESNLTRQLLFRAEDISKMKSRVGAERAMAMNPALSVIADDTRVSKEKEAHFTDGWWQGIDACVSAVDNKAARLYCDSRATLFDKPFIDVGTEGPRFSFFASVPPHSSTFQEREFLNEFLSGGSNAAAKDGTTTGNKLAAVSTIPVCTKKHFPHTPQHCIEYAWDMVKVLITLLPKHLGTLIGGGQARDDLLAQLRQGTEGASVVRMLLAAAQCLGSPPSAEEERDGEKQPLAQRCARFAWHLYHILIRDPLIELVTEFPPDRQTKSGVPFWSGHKRFPRMPVPSVDGADKQRAVDFVASVSFLLHHAIRSTDDGQPSAGLDSELWTRNANEQIATVASPPPVSFGLADVDQEISDEIATTSGGAPPSSAAGGDGLVKTTYDAAVESIRETIATAEWPWMAVEPRVVEFEKDDDANGHVTFVQVMAGLRAVAYHLEPPSFTEAKLVAGRIVPAIITTTAMAAAVGTLELMKAVAFGGATNSPSGLGESRTGREAVPARPSCGAGNLAVETPMYYKPNPAPTPLRTTFVSDEKVAIACPEGFTCRTFVTVDAFDDSPLTFGDFVEQVSVRIESTVSIVLYQGTMVFAGQRAMIKGAPDNVAEYIKSKVGADAWKVNRHFEFTVKPNVRAIAQQLGAEALGKAPTVILRRRLCPSASSAWAAAVEGSNVFRAIRAVDVFVSEFPAPEDVLENGDDDVVDVLETAWSVGEDQRPKGLVASNAPPPQRGVVSPEGPSSSEASAIAALRKAASEFLQRR